MEELRSESKWALIQRKCSCLFHGDKSKRGSMKFKPNKKASKSAQKGATLTGITRLEGSDSFKGFPQMSSVVETLLEEQKGPQSGNTAAVIFGTSDNASATQEATGKEPDTVDAAGTELDDSAPADSMFGKSTTFNPSLQFDPSLDLRLRSPDVEPDTAADPGPDRDGSEIGSEFSLGERNESYYKSHGTFGVETVKPAPPRSSKPRLIPSQSSMEESSVSSFGFQKLDGAQPTNEDKIRDWDVSMAEMIQDIGLNVGDNTDSEVSDFSTDTDSEAGTYIYSVHNDPSELDEDNDTVHTKDTETIEPPGDMETLLPVVNRSISETTGYNSLDCSLDEVNSETSLVETHVIEHHEKNTSVEVKQSALIESHTANIIRENETNERIRIEQNESAVTQHNKNKHLVTPSKTSIAKSEKMTSIAQSEKMTSIAQSEKTTSTALSQNTTSTALSQKTTSTALSEKTTSTALSQNTTSTALSQKTTSTAQSEKTTSTALSQKTTSTALSEKTTSTALSQNTTSTALSQKTTSTAQSEKTTSTALSQKTTSTALSQKTTSTAQSEKTTSTALSQNTTSTALSQKTTSTAQSEKTTSTALSQNTTSTALSEKKTSMAQSEKTTNTTDARWVEVKADDVISVTSVSTVVSSKHGSQPKRKTLDTNKREDDMGADRSKSMETIWRPVWKAEAGSSKGTMEVDLEISDPSVRQQFMNELQTLRDNDKKRSKQDLDELESDVDEVMESVSHPPESRTHHNGDVSKNMYLGGSRDGIEITTERPLMSWNTDEVMSWLQSSGLQKFMPTFEQHNINGRDLAEISMQLLDDIQIRTTEERELILSKLYELQNPSCPPLEAIMHEPPFVQSAPNSARSDDSNMSSSRSRGVKKRESFHKMKGLVPQKLFGSQEKNVVDITIWHDLLPDDSQSTDVKVDGSMSSYDVVKQVLERYDIIADSRLYYLVQIHVTDSGKDLVFQHDDHPLGIVQEWADDPSSYKIVLQCEKGLDIQLICRLPVSTSSQKLLSISSSTTCDDVIAMCVDIYGIPEEERDGVMLYTDDNPQGLTGVGLTGVAGSTILSEHQSRSFIISNLHTEKQNESPLPPLPTYPPTTDKLDSLEEQMADIEASLLVKTSQLDTTYLSMDSNNRSITEDQPIRREVSHGVNAAPPKMTNVKKTMITSMDEDVQSDEHLELLREIALMKDSISERDVIIHEYKMFNGALKEKADELSHRHDGIHNALAEQKQKEVNFHSTYVEMKHKLKVQKLQLAIVKGELDASVAQDEIHKRQLDVQEKVQKQQHMVDELQRQPGNVDKTFMQKSISMLKDLKREAMQLNTERQAVEQIRLFRKTDATSKSLSLSRVISADQSERLFHLRIRRCRSGWGFMIGRDQRNLPMIRQREDDCPAEKADVIVEMNGRTVISLPEQEIFKMLNEWSKPELSLLVIRSNEPITSSVSEEELRSVKEDLSLALLELESVQQENVDLSNHIKKSETLNSADHRKKQEMLYTIEQLKQQAATSRTQWKELREALKELRATDLRHHNLDPHILKLAGLEISPREEQTTSFEKRDSHHIINGHTSNLNGYVDEDNNKVIAYDQLDSDVPIWEGLRSAHKNEILQVLKDHVLETQQQKLYLDRLQAAVIENAPELLERVDSEAAGHSPMHTIHLKPHSEEFC